MSFESEFLDMMPFTLTHTPRSSRVTAAGVAIYSTSEEVSIRHRIEWKTQKVVDQLGNEVLSQATLYLAPTDTTSGTVEIDVADKIVLPSTHTTQVTPIISVRRVDDDEGVHHWKVVI